MPKTSFYSGTGLSSEDVSTLTQLKTDAETAATNAATSETNSAASETSSAASATAAAASALQAASSSSDAIGAKNSSEAAQAAAETSGSSATSSASSATASAAAAASSETNAASSATSASGSASTATTKASEASTSATASETSRVASVAAQAAAETAETNAASSATAGASSASASASSASSASTSETNSAASAAAASTSASGASTSASNANTSATNAASSASQAASSAAAAALAADNFDDTYLGSNASDPTTDNDGDALNAGDLHFNTTSNTLKVYNGSAWQDAAIDSSGFVQTTGDTMTGNLSMGDNVKAIFGASSDLQIYHDGTHSYISDQGAGNLRIAASDRIQFYNAATDEISAQFIAGAESQLRYAGSTKLATTSTGVDITGTLTSDGLTLADGGDRSIIGPLNNDLIINSRGNTQGEGTRIQSAGVDRLLVDDTTGDISFYEDTGTTPKFFWDASAEKLGIGGTTAPDAMITVDASVDETAFKSFSSASGNLSVFTIEHGSDLVSLTAFNSGDALAFGSSGSERMRITSSGSVGIGTSSPSLATASGSASGLEINGAVPAINLNAGSSDEFLIYGGSSNASILVGNNNPLRFLTGGSESIRIESSGALLIGKTSSDNTTVGGRFLADGFGSLVRDGNKCLVLNRKTSDGQIIDFQKDGSTVGSIGYISSGLYIDGEGGHAGLRFGGADISPRDGGADADAAIQLGSSSNRFTDLFLSGGVYLGGTGSANLLDDYEEGTFTPTIANLTNLTGTASITRAIYTKVGNLCTIQVRISGLTITSASANSFFSATLPTAAAMDAAGNPAVMGVARGTSSSASGVVTDYTGGNATQIQVLFLAETTASSGAVDIEYSLTYRTA